MALGNRIGCGSDQAAIPALLCCIEYAKASRNGAHPRHHRTDGPFDENPTPGF
jgi:hypothetical protein